jgi:hypothetical protein
MTQLQYDVYVKTLRLAIYYSLQYAVAYGKQTLSMLLKLTSAQMGYVRNVSWTWEADSPLVRSTKYNTYLMHTPKKVVIDVLPYLSLPYAIEGMQALEVPFPLYSPYLLDDGDKWYVVAELNYQVIVAFTMYDMYHKSLGAKLQSDKDHKGQNADDIAMVCQPISEWLSRIKTVILSAADFFDEIGDSRSSKRLRASIVDKVDESVTDILLLQNEALRVLNVVNTMH